MSAVRVFVGTDPRQRAAERALEASISANASCEFSIEWMRHGDAGWDGWEIGREPGKPKSGGWGTDFACFRYAVPELCGFDGRAIYLDSDMIVLGDIAELAALPFDGALLCTSQKISDVAVFDCGAFMSIPGWPPVSKMRRSGWKHAAYRKLLKGRINTGLPAEWNCRDCLPADAKLLHFTDVETQPWKPWPESVAYRSHPDRACVAVWDEYSSVNP